MSTLVTDTIIGNNAEWVILDEGTITSDVAIDVSPWNDGTYSQMRVLLNKAEFSATCDLEMTLDWNGTTIATAYEWFHNGAAVTSGADMGFARSTSDTDVNLGAGIYTGTNGAWVEVWFHNLDIDTTIQMGNWTSIYWDSTPTTAQNMGTFHRESLPNGRMTAVNFGCSTGTINGGTWRLLGKWKPVL